MRRRGRSRKYEEHGARDAGKHQLAEMPERGPAADRERARAGGAQSGPGDEKPGARGGLDTRFFSTRV
jgi:hypothetical protein